MDALLEAAAEAIAVGFPDPPDGAPTPTDL
jgi:hypothetical protein